MSTDPSYVQKLKRARGHFKTIRSALREFTDRNPCPVAYNYYPQSKKRVWSIPDDPPDPNPVWSPIFGEFLYDLRSALDHVIWRLVDKHQRGTPDSRLKFPIFDDALEFAYVMRKPLKKLPMDVLTLIERAQPYNREDLGGYYSLFQLNYLGNVDKHRHPALTIYSTAGGWAMTGDSPQGTEPWLGPVKKGTVLFEFTARTPEEMNMDYVPFFDIAFRDAPLAPWTIFQSFHAMLFGVGRLIDRLAPFAA